jgi:long-chain acyl-CoA synthetase
MRLSGSLRTLVEALLSNVERNPQKTACICGDRKISCAELDCASTRLAPPSRPQPGVRLAIHWPNTIEAVQLFFAAFKAGLIAAPINLRLKAAEIEFILNRRRLV